MKNKEICSETNDEEITSNGESDMTSQCQSKIINEFHSTEETNIYPDQSLNEILTPSFMNQKVKTCRWNRPKIKKKQWKGKIFRKKLLDLICECESSINIYV